MATMTMIIVFTAPPTPFLASSSGAAVVTSGVAGVVTSPGPGVTAGSVSTPVVGSVTGGTGGSVVSPDEVPGVVTGAVVTSGFVVTGEGVVVSSSVVEGVVALTPAMANVPDTPVTVQVT